jgi:hypothetical protein
MVNPIKSPSEMILEQAGIPHLASGGRPRPNKAQMQAALAAQGLRSQISKNSIHSEWDSDEPINLVAGYQPDPTGKFGSKTGMSTIPHIFDKTEIQNYVKAMRAAEPLGVRQLSEQELMAKLLTEGRSDFGTNYYDFNNKKANQIHQTLRDIGIDPMYATFPAAIYTTDISAKRHNVPFEHAWNGLGTSEETGKTGAEHNQKYQQFLPLVDNPLNNDLKQTISEAYNYKPQDPSVMAPLQNTDPMGNVVPATQPVKQQLPWFAKGGKVKPFRDMSKVLIQKHISGK